MGKIFNKIKELQKKLHELENIGTIEASTNEGYEMFNATVTTVSFFAMTDIVVIGVNPENADYSNPRGEIHGYSAYVVAENDSGERVRTHIATSRWEDEVMAKAVRQSDALIARLTLGKLPVAFDRWEPTFPAYGSEAFVSSEMVEWEDRIEEGVF